MDLIDIAKKYNTDKKSHGYIEVYESLFSSKRYETLSILEIGVFEGESLRLWRGYFPNAQITGIDNQEERTKCIEGCNIIYGDASSYFRDRNDSGYDIVIDDGSHLSGEIQSAFESLFPNLRDGGIYVVEDIYGSMETAKILDYFVTRHKGSCGKEFDMAVIGQMIILFKD